jgi:hypothetical protein
MVDGIPAYQFTEHISGADAGFSPLSSALSSADPQRYSVDRVYLVDAETGALINITENEDLSLVDPATGSVAAHLFRAHLFATPSTVRRLAGQDARRRDAIALTADVRLALFGASCVLAVTAGCLLLPGAWITPLRRRLPSRSGAQ